MYFEFWFLLLLHNLAQVTVDTRLAQETVAYVPYVVRTLVHNVLSGGRLVIGVKASFQVGYPISAYATYLVF